ncbi:HAD domain-containing protein [Pedobacter sp. R20-19]|uniref:HAD domain-containing protein n=1 Tax=Pedobacter sp. R20-19 TaxID=1270196 RepID=UPI0004933F5C|nr:HAD domain-containing protein [Pedobacter sp. R20-19]
MLLLLDIDGVMVPANSWRRPKILADGFTEFNIKAIAALNKVLSHTELEVVLTTSHKFKFTLNEWLNIFKTRNINLTKISRLPDNVKNLDRKGEILEWFNLDTSRDHFIILDDDKSLNALPEFLKSRLIQTSASVGFTDYLADEMLCLIEEKYLEFS